MNPQVTLYRTFWRTFFILLCILLLMSVFKSQITPHSGLSILALLSHEKSAKYLNWQTLYDLAFFIIVVVTLHLVWAYLITISCKGAYRKTLDDGNRTLVWLIIVALHILFILSANSYFYPTSLLSIFRDSWISQPIVFIGLGAVLITLLSAGFIASKRYVQLVCWLSIIIFMGLPPNNSIFPYKSKSNKPNIIIIGLDGLRPDHLYPNDLKKYDHRLMPRLEEFLENSYLYKNSYTTLPRTFVAWYSLFTSQYPNQTGARFNLSPPKYFSKKLPLLDTLKSQGYNTVYAIDERRFNAIDQSYGFDHTTGPKIGVMDHVLTKASDTPILNLLGNQRFGKYLLPYVFLNRAKGTTYDPILFNNQTLNSLSDTKPNFLSIHFCLLHHPYTSKDFFTPNKAYWHGNYSYFMYLSLLEQLDLQFAHMMIQLERHGYLDNAQVFVISDHGDSFKLSDDRLIPKRDSASQQVNVDSYGHGTNVLDQTQARIILAHQKYSNGIPLHNGTIYSGIQSIIDIMPSIYDALKLPTPKEIDGQPLPQHPSQVDNERYVFVDSSKPVKSIDTSMVDTKKVFSESVGAYTAASDGQMQLTQSAYLKFIGLQQRSLYFQNWQLAFIPELDDLILVDLNEKQWRFLAKERETMPFRDMYIKLCEHYQEEISLSDNKICSDTSSISKLYD
ncbi:sulfatase-like hydrolase/transferase [Thalassotalea litorea]|uniref:sulfatase-like hydrolase/transferase n=1 Tax=Thalassotalea litorea TaxID=2020715 RepID=UPI003736DF81